MWNASDWRRDPAPAFSSAEDGGITLSAPGRPVTSSDRSVSGVTPTTSVDDAAPAESLQQAHRAHDWATVVRVVERHWMSLMHQNFVETRAALQEVPVPIVADSIAAVAIRDFFLLRWRAGDDLLLDLARTSRLSDPHWVKALPIPRWNTSVSDAAAVMIALRTRGEMSLAQRYAESIDEVLNAWLTCAGVPGQGFPPDELSIMRHVGITRMFAGDHSGAVQTLRRAFRFSPRAAGDPAGPDAATLTAIAYGLLGEAVEAEEWLARGHDKSTELGPPGTLRTLRALAGALLAIEQGRQTQARRSLAQLESRIPGEFVWETAYVYARARYDLVWGDRRRQLRQLADERARLPRWLQADSTMGPHIDAIEAELLIAIGNGTEAQRLVAASEHPRLLVPRARLAMLSGRHDEVVRLATIGLTNAALNARDQTQLQTLKAVAQERLGDTPAARRSLTDAINSADVSGARLGLAMAPRTELCKLGAAEGLTYRLETLLSGLPEVFPASVDIVTLTTREREVLHQLADGRTIRDIADSSYLSQNTIKSQLRSLYRKLGATSRERVIALAHEHHLIDRS
ncbi:MAG: LuxR C-terminal-related transcriptional regulator [Nocardioides sp.]|uniref:helix-turn-helix transcriptional regulator n=1 Tax=Nocardioides sp. TaxID=35761 RepID=UPI0039E5A689